MARRILAACIAAGLALAACGDEGAKADTTDSADTTDTSGEITPPTCLDAPGLPEPPRAGLPCELLPPGQP